MANIGKWYKIDIRAWPCCRLSFVRLPTSDQEFNGFLGDMTRLYAKKEKFSFLFDVRGLTKIPRKYAKGLADWIEENRQNASAYLIKSGILVPNILVQAFLKITFAIHPPASPYNISQSLSETVKYLGWKDFLAKYKQKQRQQKIPK